MTHHTTLVICQLQFVIKNIVQSSAVFQTFPMCQRASSSQHNPVPVCFIDTTALRLFFYDCHISGSTAWILMNSASPTHYNIFQNRLVGLRGMLQTTGQDVIFLK